MRYTQSNAFGVHVPTSRPLHQESAAVPTAWSAEDANMLIWSLMELLNAAGISPAAFDPGTPASYQKVLQAVQEIARPEAAVLEATLKFGSASTGITYASRQGRAIVHGDLVVFQCFVQLSSKGSATGAARVVLPGLPPPAGNVPVQFSGDLMGASSHPLSGLLIGNTNEVELREYSASTSSYATPVTDALLGNSSILYLSGSYPKAP